MRSIQLCLNHEARPREPFLQIIKASDRHVQLQTWKSTSSCAWLRSSSDSFLNQAAKPGSPTCMPHKAEH